MPPHAELDAIRATISAWLETLKNETLLIFDLGASNDPIVAGPRTATLAFEPVVHERIVPRPQMLVVPAAVAAADSFARMTVMGDAREMSSSLASASDEAVASSQGWSKAKRHVRVPVLALATVVALVPPRIHLWLLKSDLQGHDASALSSLGPELLRRAHYIEMEVSLFSVPSYGCTTSACNDFCKDARPLLQGAGFDFIALQNEHVQKYHALLRGGWSGAGAACAGGGQLEPRNASRLRVGRDNEANVFARRNDTRMPKPYTEIRWPCFNRNFLCGPGRRRLSEIL